MFYRNYGPICYRFQDRASYRSKIVEFSYPPVFIALDGGDPSEFRNDLYIPKN